jgi:hypothetical protein
VELIHVLRSKRIRYGTADYWIAYYIDFMTNERMVFVRLAQAHPSL